MFDSKCLKVLSLSFQDPKDLENMITKVLKLGLEGLVLKDLMVSAELSWTVARYTGIWHQRMRQVYRWHFVIQCHIQLVNTLAFYWQGPMFRSIAWVSRLISFIVFLSSSQ